MPSPKPRPKSMRPSEGKKRSVRESRVRPEINAARASDTKKRAAAKRKSLPDNSSGQRKAAVAKKADPGSRGRKTTPIKGSKNARVTPRIVESGVGNVPMSLARLGVAIAKSGKPAVKPKKPGAPGATWKYDPYNKSSGSSAGKPKTIADRNGILVPRSKNAQKNNARVNAMHKNGTKNAIKTGILKQPAQMPKGFGSINSIASRQTKVPKKKMY